MHYQKTYNTVNGKTGSNLIYREVYGKDLSSLVMLGFKHYIKSDIYPFGSDMLVKIINSFTSSRGNLYYRVKNTINIEYIILDKNLIEV